MASLPESLVDREVFVLDPMLATGGSLVHCCGLLTERGTTSITVLCALAAPEGLAAPRGERPAAAGLHRQRRRGAQRQRLHRPRAGRRRRPPVRRGLTMRFGVLGTGFWARDVHAAALAEHPDAELVGVWGRDLAKAKALGAEFDVAGYDDLDELLARSTPCRSRSRPTCRSPLAERAAEAGKHLLLEKPIALDRRRTPTGWSTPVRDAGVASVVFFTFRFQHGDGDLAGRRPRAPSSPAARGPGSARTTSRTARSATRPGARSTGRSWDIGPHALSLLVPTLGPVVSVQAGAGRGDTVHLVFSHESGAASTVTLSLTVALDGRRHRVLRARRRRPAGAAARADDPVEAHQVAVDELTAAALTGGTHPCDVAFGRDVVAVLAAASARSPPAAARRSAVSARTARAPALPPSRRGAGRARPHRDRGRRSGRRPRAPAPPSPGTP